jgi:hypothetical protein
MPGLRAIPAVITDVGAAHRGEIRAARHLHVRVEQRCGLDHVERFARRDAFHDVDEHDVAERALHAIERAGGPHVPRAEERDLGATHELAPSTGTMETRRRP